jgi:LacI family transcriptional regulator
VFRTKRTPGRIEGWEEDQSAIAAWIQRLAKPVGIMACHDERAYELLTACSLAGVLVPDEVAVIATGNDEVLCNLCDPPLSSVEPGAERLGVAAAALLDRMMSGASAPSDPILLPPLYVVTRKSTDALAIADTQVVQALRFIRDHACDGITADDVARRVSSSSRRVLDARCKRVSNRTLHSEIRRVQIQRVKQLLADTELSLAEIASRTGFEHSEYMNVVFKRMTGQSPGRYRVACTGRKR